MSAESHRIARRARMAREAKVIAARRAAKMRSEARRDGEALGKRLGQ